MVGDSSRSPQPASPDRSFAVPLRSQSARSVGLLARAATVVSALLLAPVAALALLLRPDWRMGLTERLGKLPAGTQCGGVWVHAASIGEGLAARRLISGLRAQSLPVRATLTTLSGRDVLRQSISDPSCSLAPLDHPLCVERAMRAARPAALVLIETELWPMLIAGAARVGAPVVIVSGRLSDRSLRRYRSVRWLLQPMLGRLTRVGARTAEDAARFVALGVSAERVEVTGDLKLDPPEDAPGPDDALRRMLGDVRIAVAGSTHPGEEDAALEALSICEASGRELALVIAPRRTERFDDVWRALQATGRTIRRRSDDVEPSPLAAGEVLLLDSLGELAGVYALASASFVGGTLAPVGGHNLLEPVQAGCAVCFGPHIENLRDVAGVLVASGAGTPVVDGRTLGEAWCDLLGDGTAGDRAASGLRALEAHRGAVERSIEVVRRVLSEASSGAE